MFRLDQSILNKFYKSLFSKNHKSYYSDVDINILDEYRTIANNGILIDNNFNVSNLIEIDMSKAYTYSFSEINEIPVFNIFDNFEYYKNEPINDLSLYIIKNNKLNLFFNKQYNLCYGKYLKHFSNLEIVAVKTPSFIKQVNYKEIVDNLYNEQISDNNVEDLMIKKNIANVNIGLLEKGVNKNVHSFIYTTYEEAEYYRSIFGGNVITIQKIEEKEEYIEYWEETDFGDEQLIIKRN